VTEHLVDAGGGRVLRVEEGGDPAGFPVLYQHGTPGCGSLYRPLLEDASARGIRLIGYDRPGYGGSSRQLGRTVGDAAADVATIADALGVERLATWGISGGGPHALACAALLPGRIVAAASLASPAPYDAEGLDWLDGMGEANVVEFDATLAGEAVLRPLLEQEAAALSAGGPEGLRDGMASLLSAADAAVLGDELAEHLYDGMARGLTPGVGGWLDDDLAFVAPWHVDLGAVAVPVLLWQGRQDRFVPPGHVPWLGARIPGSEVRLTAEDGHLTLYERRIPEVHAWLLERAAA
jgi:pimeloyl-ACP methyl ester carboxylesterase